MASLHAGKLACDSQGQMGEERRRGGQKGEKEGTRRRKRWEKEKMDKNRRKDRSGNEDEGEKRKPERFFGRVGGLVEKDEGRLASLLTGHSRRF